MTTLEVLYAPAEFTALKQRDLSRTVCVVFDILRATSTMVTALGSGAAAIIPAGEIAEALALRQQQPELLLAGERDGVRIQANLTGSIGFDLGNSPREFTPERVSGKTIAMTTTNGTRALRASVSASQVLIGSFLNLGATAQYLRQQAPAHLLLVCSGTADQSAYEDILGAGAFCDSLWSQYEAGQIADSAFVARKLFRLEQGNLSGAMDLTRNGSRLMRQADLKDDVAFCAQRDRFTFVACLESDGRVRSM